MNGALRRELERLALSDADSWAALAKVQAIRMLEQADRRGTIAVPVDDDGRSMQAPIRAGGTSIAATPTRPARDGSRAGLQQIDSPERGRPPPVSGQGR